VVTTQGTRRTQPFELRRSSIQGRGAFATRMIRKGQRIAEYTGEKIDNDEADRRYDDEKMSRHHTFLFILDDDTVVDAAVGGNDSRFINHSCDPNCEAVIEGKHIYIYALRTIRPGEELAYDYQYERMPDYTEEDEKFYACRCGAENCRGSILAPKPVRKPRKKAVKKKKKVTTRRVTKGRKSGTATKRGPATRRRTAR
jgi:uncharacterized protein